MGFWGNITAGGGRIGGRIGSTRRRIGSTIGRWWIWVCIKGRGVWSVRVGLSLNIALEDLFGAVGKGIAVYATWALGTERCAVVGITMAALGFGFRAFAASVAGQTATEAWIRRGIGLKTTTTATSSAATSTTTATAAATASATTTQASICANGWCAC